MSEPVTLIAHLRRHRTRTLRLTYLSFFAIFFGWAAAFALPVLPLWPILMIPCRIASGAAMMLFPLALLAGLSFAPLTILFAPFSRKSRLEIIPATLISLAAVLGFVATIPLTVVRQDGLIAISERARPLIESIKNYRLHHGHYPRATAQLVPEYLDSIPGTGAILYRDFIYHLRPDEKSYEIRVITPVGLLNFDFFFYWPEGDYPEFRGSNPVEQIGNWAYVHE